MHASCRYVVFLAVLSTILENAAASANAFMAGRRHEAMAAKLGAKYSELELKTGRLDMPGWLLLWRPGYGSQEIQAEWYLEQANADGRVAELQAQHPDTLWALLTDSQHKNTWRSNATQGIGINPVSDLHLQAFHIQLSILDDVIANGSPPPEGTVVVRGHWSDDQEIRQPFKRTPSKDPEVPTAETGPKREAEEAPPAAGAEAEEDGMMKKPGMETTKLI